MKKHLAQPKKLTLKRVNIVELTPQQAAHLLGGGEPTKPPRTASCQACGTAMQECTGN